MWEWLKNEKNGSIEPLEKLLNVEHETQDWGRTY